MIYKAPVDSTLFLLKDVLKYRNFFKYKSYHTLDPNTLEAILREAAKLCEEVIAPTNQIGDKEGCKYVEGKVETPQAFKEAWQKFKEGGWIGLSVPEAYGGQGLPYALATAFNEFVSSSNMGFSLCPGLSRGAIQALLKVATEEQKNFFIPRMASGEWTGTMNLTEPHCGTDLGLIKTKAVPTDIADPELGQHYLITGQKIFISCGEHDLSSSIVHLVLARIEGDPEGTKGISLFIVPKHHTVTCGSIEDKMGIHGSPTCVMNYDGAIGYLLGERGKGLNAMFIMMNEARLGVAIQGLSQSELAYQNAIEYAKTRIQSSNITNSKGPSVPIIEHADVRRMLLDIKSILEPARLLCLEAAMLVDIVDNSDNMMEREDAEDRLAIYTPILKGVLTDYGFEHAVKAQQVFGGHGYIKDYGMEQIVRDARIAQIYEGTNGVQALDLITRKLTRNQGKGMGLLMMECRRILSEPSHHADAVRTSLVELEDVTQWLIKNSMTNFNNLASASYDYMKLFGLVMLGIAWVKIIDAEKDNPNEERMSLCKYFMERILTETTFLKKKIETASYTMMSAKL